jgi:hypothetical protein
VSDRAARAVEHAGRTAGVQHIVELDEPQLRRLEAWPEHCAGRATVRQSCARRVTYELPIESPWAVCEPVSPSEQRGAWKTFSTLAGTTRSMRRHVCAVCERSRWGSEMEPRLFTVKTFERAVRGLPAPGMCHEARRWQQLSGEQRAVAESVGWAEDTWDGVDRPSEEVRQWLTGHKPGVKSADRQFAQECGLLEGWADRAHRLRRPDVSVAMLERLRTRVDGRPSTTFAGYQLQADAVLAVDRLSESKYADEATMAGSCRFRLCGGCYSSLCLGDTPAMPKDAIANECNAALNLWRSLAHAAPGQRRRDVVPVEHEAFARTTQAVYYDARALRDLEAALSTLDIQELRRWAEEDGVDTPAVRAARTVAAAVREILVALQTAPDKPPGVVAVGYVQRHLTDLTLLEERLAAGVWSNASFQVKFMLHQDRHQYRQTCLKGNIVCTPQSSAPTMADGRPVALATLCENFQVVEVGDKHILQDLQRDLKQRAKMHAPLDRQLPFVRREPVREYLQFLWHYRLRGDRRRSFGTALTSPEWERYFETLPEVGIPQPLIDTATWLSSESAAEQERRAAGYKPSESGESVTDAQRAPADDDSEGPGGCGGRDEGQRGGPPPVPHSRCKYCADKATWAAVMAAGGLQMDAGAEETREAGRCTCGPRPVEDEDGSASTVPAPNNAYVVGAALIVRGSAVESEWRQCTVTHVLDRREFLSRDMTAVSIEQLGLEMDDDAPDDSPNEPYERNGYDSDGWPVDDGSLYVEVAFGCADDGSEAPVVLHVAAAGERAEGPRKGRSQSVDELDAHRFGPGPDAWRPVIVWPQLLVDIRGSGLIEVDGRSMSSADMATAACANLVQDRAGSSIYLHQHRPELLSGMGDPRMFEQLCPSLFPVGDGGPGTESERAAQSRGLQEPRRPRSPRASFEAGVQRLLLHYTGAYDAHATFMSVAFSLRVRQQILSAVRFRSTFGTLPTGATIATLASELERTIQNGGRPSPGSSVAQMEKRFATIGAAVDGSPYARRALKEPMYALTMEHGCQALFVTVNLVPVHDIRISIAAEESMFHWRDWRQERTWGSADERLRLRATRPALSALYCERMFTAYIEAFFGWVASQPGVPDQLVGQVRGLFGKVKAYAGTVESQERNTLHTHFQVWVADWGVEWLRERLTEADTRVALFRYLDTVVDCNSPSALQELHGGGGASRDSAASCREVAVGGFAQRGCGSASCDAACHSGADDAADASGSPPAQPAARSEYNPRRNPLPREWWARHPIGTFAPGVDIKHLPPPDPALRDFDKDAFDAELCARYAAAAATGGSLFHEHYHKCLVKLHGQLKCK